MEDKKTARPVDVKEKIINRLRRIEGQVRGVERMVEDDRYCMDILIQIRAIESALHNVGLEVTERHMKHCVTNAVKTGEGDAYIDELMGILKQFSKR